MLTSARSRTVFLLSSRARTAIKRSYASANDKHELSDPAPSKDSPNGLKTNELPIKAHARDQLLQESLGEAERFRMMQAPNRATIWSRSQNPRPRAMSGPRFEDTIIKHQPAPEAAIEYIHKQPVRWTHERVAVCDGGGGPLGHPRIFINVDKPEICSCNYCGLPFANEHHRKHLESLSSTPYPLVAQGGAAEAPESQRITDEALGQR